MTQSNGVLRAEDFAEMMTRHPGETGLGLDNWAGLLLDDERYEVVRPAGRSGSVLDGAFVTDGSGRPGAWLARIRSGELEVEAVEPRGLVTELLPPARTVTPDPLLEVARVENPLPAA